MASKVASIFAVANAGSVTLNWDDCGDADTHVVITDISPVELAFPGSTTISGTGLLDQDNAAGQFKFDAKLAGVSVLKDGGDLCADKHIVMPLNAGTIDFHGLNCPVAAGEISVSLDINLLDSSAVSNDLITIDLSALSDKGEKLLCAALSVEQPPTLASSADIDCSKATCEEACTCSLDKCASQIDECMSAPNCASAQTCALACGCGDTACTLKCAAASPSIKALPAAKCINSNCNIPPAKLSSAADVDCTKATCQKDCECSLEQCASEIDACLAAPNCAASQDCALACPCDNDACILKCAASSPSLKALPVAKCINSKCDSSSVTV